MINAENDISIINLIIANAFARPALFFTGGKMSPKIAKFECISAQQWDKDIKGAEITELTLPQRATKGSAGYDIMALFTIDLAPKEALKIPTGLKCKIDDGWFLGIFPKSGLGFKYHARLGNSVGIIDQDYYNNSNNEGHIWVKLTNDGDKQLHIDKGKAFCQGIFLPYGITYDDDAQEIRNGGLGSTEK